SFTLAKHLAELEDRRATGGEQPFHGELGRCLQKQIGVRLRRAACDERIEMRIDDGVARKDWRLDFQVASVDEKSANRLQQTRTPAQHFQRTSRQESFRSRNGTVR